MKRIIRLVKFLVLSTTLGVALSAWAWDGSLTATVQSYDVVVGPAGNFDFRVVLSGAPTLWTGGSNWAYTESRPKLVLHGMARH